jgi:hypothetical protein
VQVNERLNCIQRHANGKALNRIAEDRSIRLIVPRPPGLGTTAFNTVLLVMAF